VALIYPISHASSDTLQNKIMVMNEKQITPNVFGFPVSLMEMAYCFGENLKMYLTLLNL
jgi:hypothetical protein